MACQNTYSPDAVTLLNQLKDRVAVATAMIMVKLARREGESAAQFTRLFQEKYLRENQSKIDPLLEQRFLRLCQDEVLVKLRRAIPKTVLVAPMQEPEKCLFGGGSLNWLDEWCDEATTKKSKESTDPSTPALSSAGVFSYEESALKNIQFVESLLRISEACERGAAMPISTLQSLLYDDIGNKHINNQFSEDSGIATCSQRFSEDSGVSFVSNGVVKSALQTCSTTSLISLSTQCIARFVENEIKTKTTDVFLNWKGSIAEYACEILNEYSHKSDDCRETMLNLAFNVLEDVWNDNRTSQQQSWEKKVCIVQELLVNSEKSYEILQYICDKVDYFIRCLTKRIVSVPMMTEKLSLLLSLYACVCDSVKANIKARGKTSKTAPILDESDVTVMWQEKWCAANVNHQESTDWLSDVEKDQFVVLDRLVIHVHTRYPFLSFMALEALKGAKCLSSQD